MPPDQRQLLALTRRHFFRECGIGVGKIALASLLTSASGRRTSAVLAVAANPLAARASHFAPKAKRVIHLFMAGAPSQLTYRHAGRDFRLTDVHGQLVKDILA